MLNGMMMDGPLLISKILQYASEVHAEGELVSSTIEGGIHRYSYRDASARTAQLAHALDGLGIKQGDRVATLAWNGYRHFELYYAISGTGAVCHTINPRLFADQMTYIVNHAEDRCIFVDLTFVPILEKLRDQLPDNLAVIVMTDEAHMVEVAGFKDVYCYESLLSGQSQSYDWPEFDENLAAALCYTSGTTGDPKGALFSHRSSVLHALYVLAGGTKSFGEGKRILPVVPLFHVNAWGLPYNCPMSGTSLVFPGSGMDGASLFDLMDKEKVNCGYGVPTVWQGLLAEISKRGRKPEALNEVIIGGSAAPGPMIDTFELELDVSVVHGWGMTEMSPVGTLGLLRPSQRILPREEQAQLKRKQGRRLFGVELKIVNDEGERLPHDGKSVGELFVRGATIVSGYFNNAEATAAAVDKEGWFGTGDIATIDSDGLLSVVDRSKDLIKSGGEWISSLDMENVVMAHPDVVECAVIAVEDVKWDERPMLIAVRTPDATVSKESMLTYLAEHLAKWQIPDEVVFVDELPHTATGKVSKLTLRKQYGNKLLA